jgi:threonine dehydratase
MAAAEEAGGTGLLVGGADVDAAAALLEGVVRRTPLEHSRALAERVGGPVWLKC